MKKLIMFTVLVSAVTLFGFWGASKICHMFMWPATVNPSQAWYFNLGLSPEQAESLKKLESSFRPNADQFCTRICKERLELLKLMRNPDATPDEIYAKIEEIGALQVFLEKQIATHILEVKKDLTPEQSDAYLKRIERELHNSIQQAGYSKALNQ
jgi:hypothetical protein